MPTGILPGTTPNGRTAAGVPTQPRPTVPARRRRQLPWLVAGVVLVLGCALAFATVELRMAGDQSVLVATRALPVGHLLAADDLRVARVRLPAGVAAVPSATESDLVGRPLTAAVGAEQLLSPTAVAATGLLPAGQALVAVALKPGQYPPALAGGDRVQVVDAGTATATGAGPSSAAGDGTAVPAVVAGVDATAGTADGTTVLSLQVTAADAATVARLAAAGRAALILLPAGGSS